MTDERVEEIRRKHEGFHFCEPTGDVHALLAALAQAERELRGWKTSQANFEGRLKEAERERDDAIHRRDVLIQDDEWIRQERDAARAEVERLRDCQRLLHQSRPYVTPSLQLAIDAALEVATR